MVVFPKAKVNIGLRILEKRPDGFHNIETFFYPVPLCDALEFVVRKDGRKTDSLKITGLMKEDNVESNLVLKAVRLMRESFNIPYLKMHLHKVIPVGAGLGGGSSDAAETLKALNKYFSFNLSPEELHSFAGRLGSDAPFFIEATPSFAEGVGNILSEFAIDLTDYYFVLLNPGIDISTVEAYQGCIPCANGISLRQMLTLPVESWRGRVVNDFELSIFISHPLIGQLKMSLYEAGAVYASMSGSGSTVYGIFSKKRDLPGSLSKYIIFEGQV